jgi:hypothetical protein
MAWILHWPVDPKDLESLRLIEHEYQEHFKKGKSAQMMSECGEITHRLE